MSMANNNDYLDEIPADDISLYYCAATSPVKRGISMLLQAPERFYLFTRDLKADPSNNSKVLNLVDESTFGDVLYTAMFDFVQRYGHLPLFYILLEFLKKNTHAATIARLHDDLSKLLGVISNQNDKSDDGNPNKNSGGLN